MSFSRCNKLYNTQDNIQDMAERVSSGIVGLDKHMEGGFIKNSVNLLSGATGTGKTIFGLQYIWDGLLKGENGVYVSLEQEPEEVF